MTSDCRQWYVLNYIPSSGTRAAAVERTVEKFNVENNSNIEVFAPTFVEMKQLPGGTVRLVERPLLFHYVFALATADEAKALCNLVAGFSFVIDSNAREHRYATVSGAGMEAFRMIARVYGNTLPCFPVDAAELDEGDLVEIVSGPFAGITGTFLSRKGASTGNILIRVANSIASVVCDIKTEYVRILRFGRHSGQLYDRLDAFTVPLLTAARMFWAKKTLPHNLLTRISIFCSRFGVVRADSPKIDAKLQLLLLASYRILGDQDAIRKSEETYAGISRAITAPAMKALECLLLGATGPVRDRNVFRQGLDLMAGGNVRDSVATRRIREELHHYLDQ